MKILSIIKDFITKKTLITIGLSLGIVAVPLGTITTINYLQNSKEVIIYEDDTNITPKKEKEVGEGMEDSELDKLIKEQEDKKTEDKKTEDKKNEDKKNEDKKNEDKKNEDNKFEDKKVESNTTKPSTNKPSTGTASSTPKPETKPVENKPTETKPVESKPTETKPVETKPIETKPVIPTPAPTKSSGIDWALSSEYFDAITRGNANAAILPIAEWDATVDSIFLNGGSAAQVVAALDSYRYNGKEVFSNYGLGIGVDALKVSLGSNPTMDKVYEECSKLRQVKNYVYLKVYYESSTNEYILYYVSGTCTVDPFVFG